MKTLLFSLTIAAAFAFSPCAFAQAKKKEAAKPAAPAAEKPAEAKPAPKVKALPMNSRADEVDAAGKSFTHVNKDGKKVKHVVTDTTEIHQGDAAAKFEDIKVGDTVAGLRIKKSDTEYEVVKITKFGPAPAKGEKAAADKAAEKPAEKKK